MRKLIILFFAVMVGHYSSGQELFPVLVVPDGGIATVEAYTLEWTLGEVAVDAIQLPAGWVTEGFHQPVLRVFPLPSIHNESTSENTCELKIYPNPVQSLLQVWVGATGGEPVTIYLFNQQGQVINACPQALPFQHLSIDLTKHPAGIFLLVVRTSEGELVRQFRVVKIN